MRSNSVWSLYSRFRQERARKKTREIHTEPVVSLRLPDAMKEKMDEYLSALYGEAGEQAEVGYFRKIMLI